MKKGAQAPFFVNIHASMIGMHHLRRRCIARLSNHFRVLLTTQLFLTLRCSNNDALFLVRILIGRLDPARCGISALLNMHDTPLLLARFELSLRLRKTSNTCKQASS